MVKKLNKLGVENSLWNNIRAKAGSGKKPTKKMLEQEKEISKEYAMGGYINPLILDQEQYFLGGALGKGFEPGKASGVTGMAAGIASGLIPGQNKQGNTSIGGSAAKGALSGAAAGASFGPWGMAIGGAIGGIGGLISGKKQQKAELAEQAELTKIQNDETTRNALAQLNFSNSSNLPMAYGGMMNYANGGYINDNDPVTGPIKRTQVQYGTPEYEKAYKEGRIATSFDPKTMTYNVMDMPEFTVMPQKTKTKITFKDDLERIVSAGGLATSMFPPVSYGFSLAGSAIDFYDASKAESKEERDNQITEALLGLIPYSKKVKGMKQGTDFWKTRKGLKFLETVNKGVDVKDVINPNYSMGGAMPNSMETPIGGFTHFSTGGTHESNPLGGIPQGYNKEGKLRTVEAGEGKFRFKEGDYIFSNRLKYE